MPQKWVEKQEYTVCKDMNVTCRAKRFSVNGGPWEEGGAKRQFRSGDKVLCDYGKNPEWELNKAVKIPTSLVWRNCVTTKGAE